MRNLPLWGKIVLITGGARRIGRLLSLASAKSGADVIIHYNHSDQEAVKVKEEICSLGRKAWTIKIDLGERDQIDTLIAMAMEIGEIFGLINNAAIFEPITFENTSVSDWDRHTTINLTAPFLLSLSFAKQVSPDAEGRIINILDWRAFKTETAHFPYTISKAGLAALTKSMALAFSPRITVNGLALGAVLPPEHQPMDPGIITKIPAKRWAEAHEIENALSFLLTGPSYITGEIIHIDGGRHLI